jgi:60 kDa SS-A/Ro ribonucleoprotein
MSKVNPNKKSGGSFSEERLAGGTGMKSAKQSEIQALRRLTLANLLWENNAYVDGETVDKQITELIPLCTAQEVFDLAVECRLKQKLRHTPLFIAVQMLKYPEHSKLVKDLLPLIITRADMITDFLAIYKKVNEKLKPLASSAKKGLATCFNNFSEYQFAKYDRNGEIKLRDAMFLVHPKPNQGKEKLFKKIADRTLDIPDTWEVALSTGKDKKETWGRLISENKLGGLAMLRNIRNMKEVGVDHKIIKDGIKQLNTTMLLPLNYLSSARINPEFEREIEDIMIEGYKNLHTLPGKTLFIVDISGSMGHLTSGSSSFSRLDQACAMAMLAVNQCEDYEIVITAGSDSKSVGEHRHIKYPKKGFGLFKQLTEDRLGGGGIFTRQCLDWCKTNIGGEFDRIIIFSDSQDCDRNSNLKPKPFGKNNYIVDVSTHKNGINYKGSWSAEISGWSEHFLTFIGSYEGIENNFVENQ